MKTKQYLQQKGEKITAITPWLTEWVEAQHGSGLILIYWLFIMSFLSTLVLLSIGLSQGSAWIFFAGIISLRLFIYLFKIGRSFLTRMDPE